MLRSIKRHITARDHKRAEAVRGFAQAQCGSLGLPPHFIELLLLIEDKRFLTHFGIDVVALLRAIRSNLRKGAYLQGASTLAQQIYNVRTRDVRVRGRQRNLRRKSRKLVFGVLLTYRKSKLAILKEYLHGVYWGRNFYGVEAASTGYFGKPPNQLSFEESFFLVERLASPNRVRFIRLTVILQRDVVCCLLQHNQSSLNKIIDVYRSVFGEIDGVQ